MNYQPRILIIDDSEIDIFILKEWLSRECPGCILTGYSDPAQAVADLQKLASAVDAPDLIVIDINMPEMNGHEVAQKLKTINALDHVPRVVISSSMDESDMYKAQEAGVNGWLQKPLDSGTISMLLKFLPKD